MRGTVQFLCVLVCLGLGCAKDESGGDPRNEGGASNPLAGSGDDTGDRSEPPGDAGMGPGFGNSGANPGAEMPTMVEIPGTDGGMACAASSMVAEQVVLMDEIITEEVIEEIQPVAIYIMLDQSSSMMGPLWDGAVSAITAFVNDPGSEGIDVAIGYFPNPPLFPPIEHCQGVGYAVPQVPMGRLPGHAGNITGNLATHMANGIGTPTGGALEGLTQFCTQFQLDNPDEKCVGVLVTDGAPLGECPGDTPSLTGIVSTAYNGGAGNSVRTFAVGLEGADFALLDALAMAGGAVDCDDANDARFACDVSAAAGGPDQLSAALAKIRDVSTTVVETVEITTEVIDTPLECEWEIPPPPEGEVFDRDQVNVQLSAPSLNAMTLGRIDDPDDCAERGWHYDDEDDPTRIIACEATCTLIQATSQANIEILLGCATIPLE